MFPSPDDGASSSPGSGPRRTRHDYFEFEQPILDMLEQLRRLKALPGARSNPALVAETERLAAVVEELQATIYGRLTPWEKVLMARHPRRPTFRQYVELLCSDYEVLRGDRLYADDPAIQAVLGTLGGRTWAILGHEKGVTPEERTLTRGGRPRPEAFRKALRVMYLAERFGLPVLTLVDTPGADQGPEGEARGMAQTIAQCLLDMSRLRTPVIAVITGEGGSGGAIAIALGNRVLAQSNAVYSVIAPEGCAAIIYRDAARAPEAAERLKVTAEDLYRLRVIDGIIPEPLGGAHMSPQAAALAIKEHVLAAGEELAALPPETWAADRRRRFRALGQWRIDETAASTDED
jgi:acetyl-CoA carboxylase carboxyl transferase subunit alpha